MLRVLHPEGGQNLEGVALTVFGFAFFITGLMNLRTEHIRNIPFATIKPYGKYFSSYW
jgi:hypothetical protein